MLRDEELEELMHLIQAEKVPFTCPHGRPILISLTKKSLRCGLSVFSHDILRSKNENSGYYRPDRQREVRLGHSTGAQTEW